MTERLTIAQWRHDYKPRAPRSNHEHEHQVYVFDVLEINQGQYPFLQFIFAVPNATNRSKKAAFAMQREGLRSGVWDIFGPFTRKGFSGLWVELKYGKNGLSDNQKRFGAHFESENYLTKVCYSGDACLDEFEKYLGITLKRF